MAVKVETHHLIMAYKSQNIMKSLDMNESIQKNEEEVVMMTIEC